MVSKKLRSPLVHRQVAVGFLLLLHLVIEQSELLVDCEVLKVVWRMEGLVAVSEEVATSMSGLADHLAEPVVDQLRLLLIRVLLLAASLLEWLRVDGWSDWVVVF